MPFQIIRNDITKMKADVIVSPTGADAIVGGGVDSAVYRAAGLKKLLEQRRSAGRMQVGEVTATSSGRLSSRYIFHAFSPVFQDGSHGEEQLLKGCYENCLALAVEKQCGSIAFPLLSAGSNGYPVNLALEAAVSVFRDFLQTHELEIYLVVFDGESAVLSGELFPDVRAYVDEHYVETTLRNEYDGGRRRGLFRSAPAVLSQAPIDEAEPIDEAAPAAGAAPLSAAPLGLNDFIRRNAGSFEEYLQQLINRKGMTNAEVYKRANLSKQYFSKVMHGQVKPAKEKLLCIAVALKLNLDETADFLRIAGFALSPCSKTDLVFEYFIVNQNFDIFSIDIALFDCGLPSLMD